VADQPVGLASTNVTVTFCVELQLSAAGLFEYDWFS
jgi:hypothetical protein